MSKPTQVLHTRNFFIAGKVHIDAEPGTLHWFSFEIEAKAGEPARFGVFNGFATEADRDVHQAGGLARAAAANGDARGRLLNAMQMLGNIRDFLVAPLSPDAERAVDEAIQELMRRERELPATWRAA